MVSLSDHKDAITSLSWRGDGALLASGREDGQIIIWSAIDGFPTSTISPKPVFVSRAWISPPTAAW
jgi:WD40 repeat protein